MKKILALLLALLPGVAFAQSNPSTAQWQGTRTSGDGVMFYNSGKGVTLQDAAAGTALFPQGVNLRSANYTWSGNSESSSGSGNLPGPNSGFWMWPTGNITGTCTQPNTGAGGPDNCAFNRIRIKEGLLSSNGRQVVASDIEDWVNVAGSTGGRAALYTGTFIQATTGNSGGNYVGGRFDVFGNVNDNGTSFPTSTSGALFGINPSVGLNGTATFWTGLVGAEIDIEVSGSASVADKIGEQIVATTVDTIDASRESVGLSFNQQANGHGTTPGWQFGMLFGTYAGFNPIQSGGTLIGIMCHVNNCGTNPFGTVAHGIDFSTGTFSSDAFKSPGFVVDGSGNITAGPLNNMGTSLYPTAVPSIQTTCGYTTGSATLTCPTGLAINAGDTVFCTPSTDCYDGNGIWPTVVSYTSGTGAVVLSNNAQATSAASAVRFGSGQRYDINSTVMANTLMAQAGKFGNTAQGRTWWGDNNPGYTANVTNTGPSLMVASNGNIVSELVASHSLGANSWHQIALDILVRADANALSSGNAHSTWATYIQADTVASSAAYSNSITVGEWEMANRWPVVDVDPYSGVAPGPLTNLIGWGCGAGEATTNAWGTLASCSSAVYVFANNSQFRSGIVFHNLSLDTASGRIAPALALPRNYAINFYGQTGAPQWSIYNSTNGTNQSSIILGNANSMYVQGDNASATTFEVVSQGAFQSRAWIDNLTTGQNTEIDFADNTVLKWRMGKRGSDNGFNLVDIANGTVNPILITGAGNMTLGEAGKLTTIAGTPFMSAVPTTGTAAGSLCITATGAIFSKTTTGPCL